MLEQILLFVASFIANTMSAFAGGGAGLVQLPAILLLGLPFPIALATHKLVTVFLGIGAAARFFKETHLFELKLVLPVLIIGMIGTAIGAHLIIGVNETFAKLALAILTIGLGLYSFFKKEMGQSFDPKNRNLKGHLISAPVILLIGIFNGTLTSGSGLFLTVWLIQWFGLDYKRAVAYTLSFVGIAWNATGAATLTLLEEPVYWPWVPVLIIASLLGGFTGAHLGSLKGNKWIKYAFVTVTILSGLSLLVAIWL